MDLPFLTMQKLLHAVWQEVSNIDWSEYCNKNVAPYDDNGVAKYTGLLMHRSGVGCIGATTEQVGFLPHPNTSAALVATKTRLIEENDGVMCSMQLRNPEKYHWGGGIRSFNSYALTGLPEIGDHLLLAHMMMFSGILNAGDSNRLISAHSDYMQDARIYVDMNEHQYTAICNRLHAIVDRGMSTLFTLGTHDEGKRYPQRW